MSIVAVDLAAKYSAAMKMTLTAVESQWDSWQCTESQFIDRTTRFWEPSELNPPLVLIIEDLPHGVPYMTTTKDVCRLQGRFVERMKGLGFGSWILFVPPNEWRQHFDMKRGSGEQAVVSVAKEHGYEPPDLTERVSVAGDKAIAKKVLTDYCASFLIGRWALETFAVKGTFDVPRTSRYGKL